MIEEMMAMFRLIPPGYGQPQFQVPSFGCETHDCDEWRQRAHQAIRDEINRRRQAGIPLTMAQEVWARWEMDGPTDDTKPTTPAQPERE